MTEKGPYQSDRFADCKHVMFVNGHCRDCGTPLPAKVAPDCTRCGQPKRDHDYGVFCR